MPWDSWLYGTLHAGLGGRPPRWRDLLACLTNVDRVALELAPDVTLKPQQLPGPKLRDVVEPEEVRRVEETLAVFAPAWTGVDSAVVALLALSAALWTVPGSSVDRSIEDRARALCLPLVGLETLSEQLEALAEATPDELRRCIRAQLVAIDAPEATRVALAQDLIARYRRGWLAELLDGFRAALPQMTQHLVDTRNERLARRFGALALEGPTLGAIGALHLAGPRGVVAQLATDGWTVSVAPCPCVAWMSGVGTMMPSPNRDGQPAIGRSGRPAGPIGRTPFPSGSG